MFKKGLSIYCGLDDYTLENNLEYLKKAANLGYEFVFSSAHIPESTKAADDLQMIINEAAVLGIKLILDVSKPMMNTFVVPKHLYSLRLDYGFTKDEIVALSKDAPYKVELNASTLSATDVEDLIARGLNTKNTRASFNFYPKLYTAHSINDVAQKMAIYKKYQIPVLVFIPSLVGKRPPMYEGLPSIEKHRSQALDLSIEELKAMGFDEIAFGDAYASDEELSLMAHHQTEELILTLNVVDNCPLDLLEQINGIYKIRPDYNDYMLRCTSKRGSAMVKPFNTVTRYRGSVTIDNDGFRRYRGELCIQLTDLPQDDRVNVVGMVSLSEELIKALKEGQKFKMEVTK